MRTYAEIIVLRNRIDRTIERTDRIIKDMEKQGIAVIKKPGRTAQTERAQANNSNESNIGK